MAAGSRASFIASTPGYVHQGSDPTIEDIAEHWMPINDETGYDVPTDLITWSTRFLSRPAPGDG